MKAIIYEGANSRWYWRLKAANGEIVTDGGQGYASLSNAKCALNNLLIDGKRLRHSDIKVLEGTPDVKA